MCSRVLKKMVELSSLVTYSHHVVALALDVPLFLLGVEFAEEVEGNHRVEIDDNTGHHQC